MWRYDFAIALFCLHGSLACPIDCGRLPFGCFSFVAPFRPGCRCNSLFLGPCRVLVLSRNGEKDGGDGASSGGCGVVGVAWGEMTMF